MSYEFKCIFVFRIWIIAAILVLHYISQVTEVKQK